MNGLLSASRRRAAALRIVTFLRFVLLVSGIACAAPAAADPSFALDQTTATLPINSATGSFTFGLSGSGLDPKAPNLVTVSDMGPDGPKVEITTAVVAASGSTAVWKVSGRVTGFASSDAQARHLTVTLDGKALQSLAYTLKNTAPADFTWAVSGLSDKRLWSLGDDLHFVVQVGPVPAHNVRLVQSDMVGADNLTPLPTTFDLCRAERPDDCTLPTLSAGTSHQLILRAHDKNHGSDGQYTGTLLLVADEKPLGDPLPVHLIVTSRDAKWLGFGLIVLGVLLALIINPFARALVARAEALRPATVLRERAEAWQKRVAEVRQEAKGQPLAHADDLLQGIIETFSVKALERDQLIPRGLARFYAPTPSTGAASTYQAELNTASNQLGSLAMVLEKGIRAAIQIPDARSFPALLRDAIEDLDNLLAPPDVAPNAALDKAVRDRLAQLETDVSKQPAANATADLADAGNLPSLREPTTRQLDFEIGALNLFGWLFFSVSSILLGWLVLILMNPAFGTPQDYAICLLWGFGLPSAGTQLSSLGQSSISNSLGVKLVG